MPPKDPGPESPGLKRGVPVSMCLAGVSRCLVITSSWWHHRMRRSVRLGRRRERFSASLCVGDDEFGQEPVQHTADGRRSGHTGTLANP